MFNKRIDMEIYVFVIHANLNYHCILFEEKEMKMILPFEREIEGLLISNNKKENM